MSLRKAAIAFNAADSSLRVLSELPTVIERRFAKEAVGSDVIATHACHLVSQESIDSAPLPLRTMTRRSHRSKQNTQFLLPFLIQTNSVSQPPVWHASCLLTSGFCGHQNGGRSAAFRALTNEMDWIAVKELILAGVIEENGHQVSDLGTTAFH